MSLEASSKGLMRLLILGLGPRGTSPEVEFEVEGRRSGREFEREG